jgi:hypothetical protein
MDYLGARGLDDTPHHIDGGIVAVEQRGCRYDSDFIFGFIRVDFLHL